ncbi:hypothetical protein GALMADRAFT_242591 [Galerina marginata CBS 339.88]|uniref:Uncharacterized protein n=1 Tax=Galerina marginata (strain CBS 339.88) TaxID=685588 RepID=A0A067TMQ9_GALM3|nr:hypothetical protein GALMADRAFT_242591 [Galerina marginata CBS 339.88]
MTGSETFTPSEEEEELATLILTITDCLKDGALNASAAIEIFKKSGLSYKILADIWNIADSNKSGDLSHGELTVAIRLMGWVQMGEELDDGLLAKAGPMPTLEGITDVPRKPSSSHTQQFPPVIPDDVRHYKRIFMNAGPDNGLLDGEKVMSSFMTSNLSFDYLWKIKKLVDTTDRDSLTLREFSLGMYLIQSLQSCLISSVPASIPPELSNQFPDLPSGKPERSPSQISRHPSTSSLNPSPSMTHLSPPVSSNNASLPKLDEREEIWAVLPHEKLDSDRHFARLDVDHKGYVDGEPVGTFFMGYGLPSEELAKIWNLADINNDNRLTSDSFAVALHLIRQRLAGDDIPVSLPSSLRPPPRPGVSRKPSSSPTSPTLLASLKNKPPPPPPPKRDRTSSVRLPNGPIIAANVSPGPGKYSTPLSPPLSPVPMKSHSRTPMSTPSMSFMSIPTSKAPPADVLSPFEDSAAISSSYPPSRHHTPPGTPQPRPPDNSNAEALEEFKKETARLSLQVESLLSQLTVQNKLRDLNENLRNENDGLKSQMTEVERTVSELLSQNDMNGSRDLEVDGLMAELANKESHVENTERMLAVVTQDADELRSLLREAQQATTKANSEVEDLKRTVTIQEEEIKELKSRLTDMGKAMSEPSSTTNNRELRVLIRDVTKENDALKGQVRSMEKSMEQLLLSTKFHAKYDEVDRENKRLKQEMQNLELLTAQLQSQSSSHGGNGNGRSTASSRGVESLTRENDQLKAQLKDGQRSYAQLRSTSETKLVELQEKVENLTQENTRLKIDASTPPRRQTQEDNSVPPPAYDDTFV